MLFARLLRKIRKVKFARRRQSRVPIEHEFGKVSIHLPSGHLLPELQRQHVSYDRFLPELVRQLNQSDSVIDVGANCGDTLAAMVNSSPNLKYICIEPDDEFFRFLELNVARMQSSFDSLVVTPIRSLVGSRSQAALLQGSGGTKHATPSALGNFRYQRLDNILAEVGTEGVRLLKVDVDGYDFDVIDSASKTIEQNKPILFFECEPSTAEQSCGFKATIDSLVLQGYSEWAVFDNFGGLVARGLRPNDILQLIDYLGRQNAGRSTRAIFYFDILAATIEDSLAVNSALDSFLRLEPNVAESTTCPASTGH